MGIGLEWLARRLRKGQVWCALLALSLSLSVASLVGRSAHHPGPEPASLEDRTLDPTIAEPGVLAQTVSAGPSYIVLVGSFLVLFFALSLFNRRLETGASDAVGDREKSGILISSQLALALYVLQVVAGEAGTRSLRELLHLFCGLLLLTMWAKWVVASRMKSAKGLVTVWSLLNDDQLMCAGLVISASVMALAALVGGGIHPWIGISLLPAFALYLAILMSLLGIYYLIARRTVARAAGSRALALYDLSTTAILAGAPWVLLPVGLQIAGEMQLSFPGVGLRFWGLLVIAGLVITSVVLLVLHRRETIRVSTSRILYGFYFPATVVSLASLKTHRLSLDLGRLDYFAAGQQTLPAQQWSKFSSLPLLDLVPSQGLSDFLIPSLFSLFNGVQELDAMIWLPWVPTVVGFLAIYVFLALVTSPVLALLVTVLMPVKAVIFGPYALVLIPAAALVKVLRRPTFRRFVMLWLVGAALLLWRPWLGGPAILALMAIVAVVVLVEKRELVIPAAGSLALVVGLLPASLLVGEVIGGGDTHAALSSFLSLLGDSRVADVGLRELSSGSRDLAAFVQVAVPILVIGGILYFLLREVLSPGHFGASAHAVLFIAVFSLLQPARLESRLADRLLFDPSLLLLTLALFPFLVVDGGFRVRQVGRCAWLLVTLVGCSLVGSVSFYNLAGGSLAAGQPRSWSPESPRVSFDHRPHQALVEYLQTELGEEESFLDFTGSTALYVLAGKRYPLRTVTDFRVTSESIQESQVEQLEDQRVKGGLPLVIFRAPQSLSERESALPTEAISYRIAEFVYARYLPFARIAGWEIWREKGGRRGNPAAPARMIGPKAIVQNFQLGLLPFRWAREDPWESILHPEVGSILESPAVVRAHSPLRLDWKTSPGLPAAAYLHVRGRPVRGAEPMNRDGSKPELTVLYGPEPQSSFSFRFDSDSPPDLDLGRTVPLPVQERFKKNLLRRVSQYPDRLILRTSGKDPWLRRFLDLSEVPALSVGTEQWIKIRYRSTQSGKVQVFFAAKEKQFLERNSVRVPMAASGMEGAPAELVVPVLGIETGGRLVDVRVDPPTDSEFEIVDAELVEVTSSTDDHLIRLTTQFQWISQDPHSLILKSNAPIRVDSVVLRTGD